MQCCQTLDDLSSKEMAVGLGIGTDQDDMVMINVYGSGITNYCLNPRTTSIAASPKLWETLTMYFLII